MIRDIEKKHKKGNPDWINKAKVYNCLNNETKQDLKDFLIYDDLGKK